MSSAKVEPAPAESKQAATASSAPAATSRGITSFGASAIVAKASARLLKLASVKDFGEEDESPRNRRRSSILGGIRHPGRRVSMTSRSKPRAHHQSRINAFMDNNYVQAFLMFLVVYALYGEDIRRFTFRQADIYFDVATSCCIGIFILEILLQVIGRPEKYFAYGLGFYFLLDVVSTASMFFDLTYLTVLLNGEAAGGGSAVDAAEAAKASKSGARAARFVRVVRLVRMVRIVKLYKMAQGRNKSSNDEDSDVKTGMDITLNGGSKVGQELTEKITRRLVLLILALVIVVPFFDVSFLEDRMNRQQVKGLQLIHHTRMNGNGTGRVDQTTFGQLISQYQRDSGPLMHLDLETCPSDYCNYSWPMNVTDQWLLGTRYHPKVGWAHTPADQLYTTKRDVFAPHNVDQSVVNEANFGRFRLPLDRIFERYRTDELNDVIVEGCFSAWNVTGQGTDAVHHGMRDNYNTNPERESSKCVARAIFFDKWRAEFSAMLSIFKTTFIMFVLVGSAYAFGEDIHTFVIVPLDRMIALIMTLSKNPLRKVEREVGLPSSPGSPVSSGGGSHGSFNASTTGSQRPSAESMPEEAAMFMQQADENYETVMIEETLTKISTLLQIGFGDAGKDIIAHNLKEEQLQVLLPGHKVTCVFGFGIIEDFTETVSCLTSEVVTYINTIAQIVHSDVSMYYGAANKNMGGAFLLAWKICDGQLPGLRDPRDAAPGADDDGEGGGGGGGGGEGGEGKDGGSPVRRLSIGYKEKSVVEARKRIRITVKGSGSSSKKIGAEEMCDSALAAFIKVRVDVQNANEDGRFGPFIHHKAVRDFFGADFKVVMGFGLHIGWAIEGAIGSKFKMDVSYLSPNVNMSARLEAATHQFQTPMLISEWLVGELSPPARRLCRLIDRVTVKGSAIPMSLYTFDIFNYPRQIFEPQFDRTGRQRRTAFNSWAIMALRDGVDSGFFPLFDSAVQDYLRGDWSKAKANLDECLEMRKDDGPTQSLLRVMGKFDFKAPADWKGYRALTSK